MSFFTPFFLTESSHGLTTTVRLLGLTTFISYLDHTYVASNEKMKPSLVQGGGKRIITKKMKLVEMMMPLGKKARTSTTTASVMTTITMLLFLLLSITASSTALLLVSGKMTTATTHRPDTTDYRSLLLNDVPMMDVRAPIEYEKGSFQSAHNYPLMTNDERHQVGICYKEQGQDAAIELGHELVCGEIKKERMEEWAKFAHNHESDGYLFCFRGGLRSNTVQKWIEQETGIRLPLVIGGYKAMRNFLLEELDRSLAPERTSIIRVCGPTGSGKTRVILQVPGTSIDLGGLAHHRGSSFGQWPKDPEQPSQIDFENSLSMIGLLKLLNKIEGSRTSSKGKVSVFVEDEGTRIGKLSIPLVMRERMIACEGIVLIEEDVEDRVSMILEDYVFDLGRRYTDIYRSKLGMEKHRDHRQNNRTKEAVDD
jgi:tRNA 2-selenouridine synthase